MSAFPLDSRFGLAAASTSTTTASSDAPARPVFLEQERPGADTVALARRWIDAAGDAPWFCWVHLFEPHFPYEPPEPLRRRASGASPTTARWPRPTPRSGRSSSPCWRPGARAAARGPDRRTTASRSASTARRRTASSPTRRRCASPSSSTSRGSCGRAWSAAPARHVDLLPDDPRRARAAGPRGAAGPSLLAVAAGERRRSATYFEALSGQLNRGWAPLHGVIRGREVRRPADPGALRPRRRPRRDAQPGRVPAAGARGAARGLALFRADRGARPPRRTRRRANVCGASATSPPARARPRSATPRTTTRSA